ncbi:MAG TPA: RdgB/HAM1 family non-canonical purine NTP pyrophosphatase [Dehalococcoidia bacterium]|nr:RdgB/HAM1 family non-canonical purine NTP pyrophosphatase [Dehalococcoidia bacterium]
MPRLLIATSNPGKAAELRILLDSCGWDVVTPTDIGINLDVDEDGDTYEANACKKALAGMEASGLVTLADDSGIEIAAMNGEPGVQSARFLGEEATFPQRFAEIFRRLEGLPRSERACRFVCVMAVADPRSSEVKTSEGEVRGLVADEPRGEAGFGYDPIFWVPQHTATMAELPEHEKNIISHRARAAAGARQVLRELLHAHSEGDPSYSRS